eukprot:5782707-Heterocapsa_arctica.AAC.1
MCGRHEEADQGRDARELKGSDDRHAVIVSYRDIGNLCVKIQSAADFIEKKGMLCNKMHLCLPCKALADTHKNQ